MSVRRSSSGPESTPNDFVPFPAAVALLGSVDGGNTFSAVQLDTIPGGLSVDTSSDLSALVGIPVGALVFVRSRGRSFECVPSGAGDIPGIGVSWKSLPQSSSLAWLSQATWAIDAINGSDDATGVNDANALRTCAELYARLGACSWTWSQSVTIRILSDCDALILDFLFSSVGLTCVVEGVLSDPLLVSQVTSFSGFVGNVSARLQLAGVVDWTPWVNQRLRIVGGARAGGVTWVAQSNPNGAGASLAATLQGVKLDGSYSSTGVSPVPGDTMAVDVLRAVPYVRVRARTPDLSPSNTIPAVHLKNLSIETLDHLSVSASRAGCWVFGSYVHHVYARSFIDSAGGSPVLKLFGCRINPDVLGNVATDYCLISQTDRTVLKVVGHWLSGHDLVQGPYLLIAGPTGFLDASGGSFGVQEVASTSGGGALRFQNNGRANFSSNCYGQSSVGIVGINMGGGGASLTWSASQPTITGALGDIQVNAFTAASRPILTWVGIGGIWADGLLQGTAQLGAGGFVDVTIPSWLSTQSISVSYRTPGAAAGVLSVPLANRAAGGFRIVGAAADAASTVDWFVGPLGAQQFIGKL